MFQSGETMKTDTRNIQASDAFFRIFGMTRVEADNVTECPRCGVGLVRDGQCSHCQDPSNYLGVNWSEVG